MGAELLIGGIGFGVSAFSRFMAGKARSEQASRNAALAEAAAADALVRGEQQVFRTRLIGQRRVGAQTAGYAHAGVDISSGSPATVIGTTSMVTELEAQIQRNNAAREAWGYRTTAGNFRAEANAYSDAATLDMIGGASGAAGYAAWKRSGSPTGSPSGYTGPEFWPGGSHEGWP